MFLNEFNLIIYHILILSRILENLILFMSIGLKYLGYEKKCKLHNNNIQHIYFFF